MPLSGEAKAKYNERYYRTRRAREVMSKLRPREIRVIEGITEGKTVGQALSAAGFHPNSSTLRERLRHGGDMAEGLRVLLADRGLTVKTLIDKTKAKLDASRRYGSGEDAIVADDNDAQLRAVEIGLRLHERAGTLPVAPTDGHATSQVQVIYQRITLQVAQVPDSIEVESPI